MIVVWRVKASSYIDMETTKLIISVKEARKILGKKISDKMSDEEVERLIIDLDEIARFTIRGILDGSIDLKDTIPLRHTSM